MNWVLDLDGVVWLADTAIPGAADAVARLQQSGEPVVFVTNNSNPRAADYEDKLARHGINGRGAVISSAMAAASLIAPGERVLVCGGPGVVEALEGRGATIIEERGGGSVDVVLVGFHRDFNYERMRIAATAVRAGARLVATNDDATYPTPDGLIPGAGSILAGIERASGVRAVVAGKPYAPMADAVRARLGGQGTVVGDRPDTDGRFATVLGYRFALVLTGVITAEEVASVVDPKPDEVAPTLAALVDRYFASQ